MSDKVELNDSSLKQATGGVVIKGRNWNTYIVKPGDTLASIAQKLGVGQSNSISLNNIKTPDKISVGMTLYYPA